jgi:hypothetical protein
MSETRHISPSSFITALGVSIANIINLSKSVSVESELFIGWPMPLMQTALTNRRIVREPRPAIKGTARGFKPNIHKLVPELENLSEEDLEKLIGESSKFDFDND